MNRIYIKLYNLLRLDIILNNSTELPSKREVRDDEKAQALLGGMLVTSDRVELVRYRASASANRYEAWEQVLERY